MTWTRASASRYVALWIFSAAVGSRARRGSRAETSMPTAYPCEAGRAAVRVASPRAAADVEHPVGGPDARRREQRVAGRPAEVRARRHELSRAVCRVKAPSTRSTAANAPWATRRTRRSSGSSGRRQAATSSSVMR